MWRNSGVSLIELLLAIVIVSGVLAMVTVLFPKATKSIFRNRQNTMASNLATAKIDDMLRQPYSYIDPTPPGGYFSSVADPGCDCSQGVTFTNLPATATEVIPSTGTVYTRYTCVNFITYAPVGGATTPHCPGSVLGDTGTKYIRVRVSWTSGQDAVNIDQESVKALY